ncbi:hypothetical protein NNJEOMEG_03960 [Fundidesulfovibrio magnetotacticus]|uniref:DUF5132 domain-containing protein n=1 Tax=Fundidesulfovibrio magnetotacticus TaxID=2730080 RepID=A0A6V8M2D8_9BACT|nr:hypothetical protein [Fundidesulfovibrio magnetotacticus]GFK96086.1 hypothetical protein NNJEOMEG_03960 [Fundidesulfovibrio magnetotacticus]
MNLTSRDLLLIAGGAAAGALAVYALTRGAPAIKPLVTNAMASGLDIKEKVLGVVDHAKEHLEDFLAEAEQARKQTAGDAPAEESQTS